MVSLLVRDCGIAFLYEAAVEQEIRQGLLKEIRLEDFSMDHEFLFLWNKGSVFPAKLKKLCEEWIQLDKDASGGDNAAPGFETGDEISEERGKGMREREFYLPSSDGHSRLHCMEWLPDGRSWEPYRSSTG